MKVSALAALAIAAAVGVMMLVPSAVVSPAGETPGKKAPQAPEKVPVNSESVVGVDYTTVLFTVNGSPKLHLTPTSIDGECLSHVVAHFKNTYGERFGLFNFVFTDSGGDALRKEAAGKKFGMVIEATVVKLINSEYHFDIGMVQTFSLLTKSGWKGLYEAEMPAPSQNDKVGSSGYRRVFYPPGNAGVRPLCQCMLPVKAKSTKTVEGQTEVTAEVQNRFPFLVSCLKVGLETTNARESIAETENANLVEIDDVLPAGAKKTIVMRFTESKADVEKSVIILRPCVVDNGDPVKPPTHLADDGSDKGTHRRAVALVMLSVSSEDRSGEIGQCYRKMMVRALSATTKKEYEAAYEDGMTQMLALLTPEQQKRHDDLVKKMGL